MKNSKGSETMTKELLDVCESIQTHLLDQRHYRHLLEESSRGNRQVLFVCISFFITRGCIHSPEQERKRKHPLMGHGHIIILLPPFHPPFRILGSHALVPSVLLMSPGQGFELQSAI